MAVTGLWEVIAQLPRFARILRELESEMRSNRPDALIPIDYPDFNLRLARRARGLHIPVIYYISPQVWAWRRGRLRALAHLVRRMMVIFPFEEDLYRRAGIPVSYVGHPLVDRVHPRVPRAPMRASLGLKNGEFLIALLPGSRPGEIARILPVFLETRRLLADLGQLRWVLALAPGLGKEAIGAQAQGDPGLEIRIGETYEVLGAADLALTASGTATLEAAILGIPMIVVYKMHPLTWQIARRMVRVPHVAMANLLAGERVVPEFLQGDARAETLASEARRWIASASLRQQAAERLRGATARLGSGGAARRAAEAILRELEDR